MRTVPIKVTSESGKEIDYVLTIYKQSALTELEELTVDGKEPIKNNFLNYSIMVEKDVTEVEIKAKAIYDLAKVNINNLGEEVKQTTRKVTLEGDETIVKIKVITEGEEKEYTLTINRKPDTSGLAFVYVNGEKVEQTSEKTYEAYIAANSKNAEVLAIANVETSMVQIGMNEQEAGRSTVTVDTEELTNTYIITVTDSENVENTENYTLIIKKPSTDNTLKEIIIQNNEMQVIAEKVKGTNNYIAKVNEKYTDMTVIAKANYEFSEVSIDTNDYKVAQDTLGIQLNENTYTLPIKVKSQDGTEAEYTLQIVKQSSNTNISSVKVDGIEAELNENTYEVTLTNKLTKVEVNAKTEDENAQIAIDNIVYEKAEITKELDMDSKDITANINVKAEDGTTKTYNLIIHSLPDNTNLTEITVNGIKAILQPYSKTYVARVPIALTEYEVTAVSEDELAMVEFIDVGAGPVSARTE